METRKGRTIVAACTLALCGAASSQAAAASPAQDAREPAASMALVVFEGVPGSEALLHGDYEGGLRQSLEASVRGTGRHAFELASNICVAQLKLGELEAAREHCGEVIELRVDRREGVVMAERFKAVALVNHGVLLSAQGDPQAARLHFEEARRKFPELAVAGSNLQHVGSAPRVTVGEDL